MNGIQQVEPKTVSQWLGAGEALIVDVREPDEFARQRIAGARLVPLSKFDPHAAREGGNGHRLVMVCKSGRRAGEAAARLLGGGDDPVVLAGGMDAWAAAGLPVEGDPRAPIPIMRQVQITAGGIVLVGTILGAAVSPWLLIIPGFIGAGLVFAGVSGTCGMAAMLARMPWNRRARAACAPASGT